MDSWTNIASMGSLEGQTVTAYALGRASHADPRAAVP